MTASEHRARARAALKGNWMWAALTSFVASLLGGISTSGGSSVSNSRTESLEGINLENLGNYLADYIPLILGASLFAVVLGLVFMVLGSVVALGYRKYTLNLIDGEPAEFSQLFSQFHRLWVALRMRLVIYGLEIGSLIPVALLTALLPPLGLILIPAWTVALIYVSYGFLMADFVLAEDEACGAREALRRSWELMQGQRLENFFLTLSFIGWVLLSAFTFGIGNLFLAPYIHVSQASFYRNLKPREMEYRPNGGYIDGISVNSEYL